jgi:hypothetical protein
MSTQWLMSGLVMAMGLLAVAVGIAMARHRISAVHRTHQRTEALSAATLESWNAWFLGGFFELTSGFQWLWAFAASLAWVLAGVGFIGLGIWLIGH